MGLGFWVYRVQGLEFRVWGLGCSRCIYHVRVIGILQLLDSITARVLGLRLRVQGFRGLGDFWF